MIKWLDELFKSFHPLFICAIIGMAFMLGMAIDRLVVSPRPSQAQDSAAKEPPHMVKVRIRYKSLPINNTPGKLGNIVDTEDGQRCFLHCYWGEVDDTFFVSSDQLRDYLPPPNKSEKLEPLPLDIEIDVTPLSNEDEKQ